MKQMEDEGQAPTVVTWNTLLRGYARKGRAGRTVSFLAAMQARFLTLDAAAAACHLLFALIRTSARYYTPDYRAPPPPPLLSCHPR